MKGNMRVAGFLLADRVKAYSRDSRWQTALYRAAAAMRLLPDSGVDIEAKTKDGWTALRSAAANGRDAVVRLLLKAGADTEAKAEDGRTVLHLASANGRDAVVQLLLEAKVDVKAKDRDGLTALHHAAANGHEAVVRLLIKKINIDVRTTLVQQHCTGPL
jgi:ankyrin repeat protein